MERVVSYDRQTTNSPNPIARYAHRKRVANSVSLIAKHLPQDGRVCDFGAGTGLILSALADSRPDAVLYAVEPFMLQSQDSRIAYVSGLRELPCKLDMLVSFETSEHLTDSELENFLNEGAGALNDNGKLILSVPIMMGAALLLKELNRSVLFRRRSEYSITELIAGVLGRQVQRPANRLPTHKGFDFRWLQHEVAKLFVVEQRLLSPLPLPWWMNSQVFLVCSRKPGPRI